MAPSLIRRNSENFGRLNKVHTINRGRQSHNTSDQFSKNRRRSVSQEDHRENKTSFLKTEFPRFQSLSRFLSAYPGHQKEGKIKNQEINECTNDSTSNIEFPKVKYRFVLPLYMTFNI